MDMRPVESFPFHVTLKGSMKNNNTLYPKTGVQGRTKGKNRFSRRKRVPGHLSHKGEIHPRQTSLTQQVILQVLPEREEEHSFSGRVDTTEFRPIPRCSDDPCWWTWQKTAGGKEGRGMNRDRGLSGSPLVSGKRIRTKKGEKRSSTYTCLENNRIEEK